MSKLLKRMEKKELPEEIQIKKVQKPDLQIKYV